MRDGVVLLTCSVLGWMIVFDEKGISDRRGRGEYLYLSTESLEQTRSERQTISRCMLNATIYR